MKALSKKLAAMGLDPAMLAAAEALDGDARGRAAPGRGRPSTGARERILEAALEVLKADGLRRADASRRSPRARARSKALIAYHFGSKQGLVAAAGASSARRSPTRCSAASGARARSRSVVRGAVAGVWALLERDERLARVYFDLNAVSVVEDERPRRHARGQGRIPHACSPASSREADDPVSARAAPALAVLIIAGIEGLCLERIERGDDGGSAARPRALRTLDRRRARLRLAGSTPSASGSALTTRTRDGTASRAGPSARRRTASCERAWPASAGRGATAARAPTTTNT